VRNAEVIEPQGLITIVTCSDNKNPSQVPINTTKDTMKEKKKKKE